MQYFRWLSARASRGPGDVMGAEPTRRPGPIPTLQALLILLLLAVMTLLVRAQTFDNPVVGFDEQFYLLVGDRLLKDAIPYVDIFDRKPIGLFLIYAGSCLLGDTPFLQYKLVAAVFACLTAFGLYGIARRVTSTFGAACCAIAYLLWLDLMEGEGGQSPVFYNLPMVIAALFVLRALERPTTLGRSGAYAMLAVGVALQIKYSVLFEGIAMGLLLTAKAGASLPRSELARSILLWAACALVPTACALGSYAMLGYTRAFVFANFVSVFGQAREPPADAAWHLAAIVGILAPLGLALIISRPWRTVRPEGRTTFALLLAWLGIAAVSVLAFGRFGSPHYALPILLPLSLSVAPVFDRWKAFACGLLAAILLLGQITLSLEAAGKGGREEALQVAAAARPAGGCIYVFDGYPALYMLTHSCLPSRWVFPGHLNARNEAGIAAIGVDPAAEVKRILATRPDAIVDDYPTYERGNAVTHAIVRRALKGSYRLIACIPTGSARVRLVYRRIDLAGPAIALGCPASADQPPDFIARRSDIPRRAPSGSVPFGNPDRSWRAGG